MSKSDPNPMGALFLDDSDSEIRKKIKKAVTDTGTEVTYEENKPGIKNLITIQAAILGKSPEQIVDQYVGKQYGHLKAETAEIAVSAIAPIRQRVSDLLNDRTYLESLLSKGATTARQRAKQTLSKLYERIGFISGRYSF
jgi:tryptophanyl-tRNA synthetase